MRSYLNKKRQIIIGRGGGGILTLFQGQNITIIICVFFFIQITSILSLQDVNIIRSMFFLVLLRLSVGKGFDEISSNNNQF